MRLRIRGPSGQSSITLPAGATVHDLRASITEKTSVQDFDLKYGYPPKTLVLEDYDSATKLSAISTKLDGEQLLVSTKTSGVHTAPLQPAANPQKSLETQTKTQPSGPKPVDDFTTIDPPSAFSFSGVGEAPPPDLVSSPPMQRRDPSQPLSLQRKPNSTADDPPEIPLLSHEAKIVLRVMPDDNSCLFRAFGSAFFGIMDNMTELRSIIASHIQEHGEQYNEVVLEKQPDDYCRWIQTEDAWGGAIELNVLSQQFDIEICSVDVQTLRVDRFNEGKSKRCILVYSGIHYDTVALSHSTPYVAGGYAEPEEDIKIFDAADDTILAAALELCAELQKRHYFTDTAGFQVRCNICKQTFVGEKGATEHASKTGHYDFGEAG
ncbi:MAG: hypothetical protein Q9201_004051 [Fulgogasparrea decipioides]